MTLSSTWPRHGKVTLKPFTEPLSETEWRRFYECFRDPEIAEWNGSRPLRMPLWLFKRVVMGEVGRGDRLGFGILDEQGEWLGTVELYELTPSEATLGILIGAKDRWGQGYGTDALKAVLAYAFGHMGLKRIKLRTYKHNLRAQRAFLKAGFRYVQKPAQSPPRLSFGLGPRLEFVAMEITKEEWEGF
ncbi:N-acetyltransferase [Meiothermus sp. QL-1]|uniref:GNAT family N-acetyltransferase n=1 Tax=Meiothermus sp. QL-1 TaxID=2058095 RepID=UPI000E0A0E92|nr:GNAT family N-acetyltransferase [Meiothermus sp. QL-1]RDI96201.1 N-acetyltransferase [Meiothermus sp. QL-1]